MKINENYKVGTKEEKYIELDEHGKEVEKVRIVDVYETRTRDMTPKEEKAYLEQAEKIKKEIEESKGSISK